MIETTFFNLTLLAAIGSGLMAGIFFIFSNTVMSALDQMPASQSVTAMQAINRVILNPLFFIAFMGTALVSLVLAVSLLWRWPEVNGTYLLVGSLFYLIGNILVTIIFNVPMNEALDLVKPESGEASQRWAKYLTNWTAWNHVRTVTAILATASFILALG